MGGNFMRFLGILANQTQEWRDTALTDEINNFTIDTCYAPDTEKWETGIQPKGKAWIGVEAYESEEEAKIGHKKWCDKIKKNPKMKLETYMSSEEWFFG